MYNHNSLNYNDICNIIQGELVTVAGEYIKLHLTIYFAILSPMRRYKKLIQEIGKVNLRASL